MDPLTQGTLGAALPASISKRPSLLLAGALGFAAGMAADLDVLIRSDTDPLLFLEYHRHFSHSLLFAPIGGLVCALFYHAVWGRRHDVPLRWAWMVSALAYATHPLLDAATSYGTSLFWPLTDTRFSFSLVSVVDPLLSLPALALTLAGIFTRRKAMAVISVCWVLLYLAAGWHQQQTALAAVERLAQSRGHHPLRIDVKPTFANIIVWKTVYETDTSFYVDAVRTLGETSVIEGKSVAKLNPARDLPWLAPRSQQARDVARFHFFSDGYIALDPDAPTRIVDVRYSFLPHEIDALWSIGLGVDRPADAHVTYNTHRENAGQKFERLWAMVVGR